MLIKYLLKRLKGDRLFYVFQSKYSKVSKVFWKPVNADDDEYFCTGTEVKY